VTGLHVDALRTFADQTSHIRRPCFAPLATEFRTFGDQLPWWSPAQSMAWQCYPAA